MEWPLQLLHPILPIKVYFLVSVFNIILSPFPCFFSINFSNHQFFCFYSHTDSQSNSTLSNHEGLSKPTCLNQTDKTTIAAIGSNSCNKGLLVCYTVVCLIFHMGNCSRALVCQVCQWITTGKTF